MTPTQLDDARRARIVGAIRQAMRAFPNGFTAQQVARMAYVDHLDVVAHLAEYVAHGLIEVVSTDRYRRTDMSARAVHPTNHTPKDIA